MTEPTTGRKPRASRAKKTEETAVTLEVVQDVVDQSATDADSKREVVNRDLSVGGVGLIGGFETADPTEVPPSEKSKDVSYLYAPMRESYKAWDAEDGGLWKASVVLDADAFDRALRLAAVKLGYGLTVRKEEVQTPNDDGDMMDAFKMYFMCRPKKASQSE